MTSDPYAPQGWEEPEAKARLADLRAIGGADTARRLLSRFADFLGETAAAEAAPLPAEAYRVVGLAGMFGFRRLEALWREAAEADPADPERVAPARRAAAAAQRLARELLATT